MSNNRVQLPPSLLTGHLKSPEDKKKFLSSAKNAIPVLDKLLEICYNNSITQRTNLEAYDSPSWSHKQAHINGYNELYTKLSEIVDTLRNMKT